MKKENNNGNFIKRMWSGRAAQIFAVTATVFLCFLTAFEYVALRMEWDIPVLQVIAGDSDSYLFQEYRNEEMALDDSTENILFRENAKEQDYNLAAESEENWRKEENGNVGETVEDMENTDTVESPDTSEKVDSKDNEKNDSNEDNTEENGNTETAEPVEEEFPYYIKVNRQQNCITVYTTDENGEYTVPYKAMICSTGLYNATPRGTFHLSTKYLWRELFGNVYGQYATRITGGVLFHSVPYYRRSKSALCTEKYNKLGQQASMGCVRLTVEDAKWIAENCPSGTTVEIYDDKENPGPLGKPEAMKIDTDNPNKGWDPTDPDETNPWHELSEDN